MHNPEAKHPNTGINKITAQRVFRLIVQIEYIPVTDLHQVAIPRIILGNFAATENLVHWEHLSRKDKANRELPVVVTDDLDFLLDIIKLS